MMCYRDMTFCSDECANLTCHRNQRTIDWHNFERVGLPLSISPFGTQGDCPVYEPDDQRLNWEHWENGNHDESDVSGTDSVLRSEESASGGSGGSSFGSDDAYKK